MRLLLLHLRCRQVPPAALAAAASVAALWWIDRVTDHRLAGVLALFAAVAAVAAAGPGLAGPDVALERTGALAWPLWRAVHVIAAAAVAAGLILLIDDDHHLGLVVRDAGGLAGLLALGATAVGAGRAWVFPAAWMLLGQILGLRVEHASRNAVQQVLTWMLQPAGSGSAAGTAVLLGVAGLLVYALAGPRLAEPNR